jgi:syndecan 4
MEGFGGADCQVCDEDVYSGSCIMPCDAKIDCSRNGRCRGLDGSCICDDGWTGASCNQSGVDACMEGFGGADCQVCDEDVYSGICNVPCDAKVDCSRNGRCRGKDGSCICDDGWTGPSCNRSGAGACMEGFGGADCQVCDEDVYSGI